MADKYFFAIFGLGKDHVVLLLFEKTPCRLHLDINQKPSPSQNSQN